jgi:uncharacterized protein
MDECVRIYQEARRRFDEDQQRYERQRRQCELTQAAIQAAIDLYMAQLSAPWQALAWHIRATDSAGDNQ